MDITRFTQAPFFLPTILLVGLIVTLLAVVGIVAFFSRKSRAKSRAEAGIEAGYKASGELRVQRALFFSPTERALLGALDRALGSGYRVFGKVRVADLLEPRSGPLGGRTRRLLRGQVDYVVCRASDLSVLCAINLEPDRAPGVHKQTEKKRRAHLEAAFHGADLPLLWLPERQSYALQSVHTLLAPILAPTGVRAPVDKREKAGPRTLETHLN